MNVSEGTEVGGSVGGEEFLVLASTCSFASLAIDVRYISSALASLLKIKL